MSGIRINKLEGHYTIKRVKKLPKRGNSNWLYTLEKDNMSIFYIWTLENDYEKISIADSLSFATDIQQGTNITITGTGTVVDPYIINAVAETAADTPVTPIGNLESNNVQDALEELQTDIDLFSVQSDWDQTDNTQPDFIQNKPINTSEFVNDGEDGSNPYIQQDNPILPRIVSGILDNNTGIATFIRDDSSNFSVDFSNFLGNDITNTSELTNDGEDGSNPYITDQDIPVYTLDINANLIRLLRNGVVVSSESLSVYFDDTNLARLVSGILDSNTGIATFTRDDSTTFDVDFSSLLGGIIIDNVLNSTSNNALENQVIEDTFQKTILAATQEPIYRQPFTSFSYKRNSSITSSLSGVTPDSNVIMVSSNTINSNDWYMLIEDSFLSSNDLLSEHFSNSGTLVHFYMGDTTQVFGTPIDHIQRVLSIVINTTPVTDFSDIPTGYTLYREQNIINSIVSGSSVPSIKSFNISLVKPNSPSSGVQSIIEGTNITVDNTDPLNPIISSIGGSTDLNNIPSASGIEITSSTGNNTTIPLSDVNNSGLMPSNFYGKGTFSPTLTGNNGVTYSFSTISGYFWKTGNIVQITVFINGITQSGGISTSTRIENLPFPSDINHFSSNVICNNADIAARDIVVSIFNNATFLSIANKNGIGLATGLNFTGTGNLTLSITYCTNI